MVNDLVKDHHSISHMYTQSPVRNHHGGLFGGYRIHWDILVACILFPFLYSDIGKTMADV